MLPWRQSTPEAKMKMIWTIDERLTLTSHFASDIPFRRIPENSAEFRRPGRDDDGQDYEPPTTLLSGVQQLDDGELAQCEGIGYEHPRRASRDLVVMHRPSRSVAVFLGECADNRIDFFGRHLFFPPHRRTFSAVSVPTEQCLRLFGRQDACATTIYGRLRSEVAREVSRHLPTSLLSSDNSGSTKGVRIAKCAVLLAGRAREERRIDGLLVDTQRAMHGARRIRTNCPRVRRGREGAKPTPRRNPRRDSPLPAPCEQTVRLFCPDAESGPKPPCRLACVVVIERGKGRARVRWQCFAWKIVRVDADFWALSFLVVDFGAIPRYTECLLCSLRQGLSALSRCCCAVPLHLGSLFA